MINGIACQSGAGAEKAFAKLCDYIGIDEFYADMILIDPKARPSEQNDLTINTFCMKLQNE